MEALITMSNRELNRIEVLQKLKDKRLTQSTAATLLNLSLRQVKRLHKVYMSQGSAGLASKKRGKASNYQLPSCIKQKAIIHLVYDSFENNFSSSTDLLI